MRKLLALALALVAAATAAPAGWRPPATAGLDPKPYPAICTDDSGYIHVMSRLGSGSDCVHHSIRDSRDGGVSWSPANDHVLRTPQQGQSEDDSPFLLARDSSLYVFGWNHLYSFSGLWCNVSRNRGRTWPYYSNRVADAPQLRCSPVAGFAGDSLLVLHAGPSYPGSDIVMAKSDAQAQNWNSSTILSAQNEQQCGDAVFAGGGIYVVWEDNQTNVLYNHIYVSESHDGGGTWSTSTPVRLGALGRSFNRPRLAIGGAYWHIVYEQAASSSTSEVPDSAWYARVPLAGGTAEHVPLCAGGYAAVASDADGCHVVAGRFTAPSTWRLGYFHSPDFGASWNAPVDVSDGRPMQPRKPAICSDFQGRHIVYAATMSSIADVLYKQNDILVPAAPQGLRIAGVELVEPGVRVTLAWDANAEPDIAGYNVWRSVGPGAPVKLNAELVPPTAEPGYVDLIPYGRDFTWYVTAVDLAENASGASSTVRFGGPLSGFDGSFANNGRKLLRDPGTGDLLRTFAADDSVFVYVAGEDWDDPLALDAGDCPAIASAGAPGAFVVYRRGNDICYRVRVQGSSWTGGVLYSATENQSVGPPSVSAPVGQLQTPQYAHAAFPVYNSATNSSFVYLAKFSTAQTALSVVATSAGTPRDSFVSVACTPGDYATIAWQQGTTLRCVSTKVLPGQWSGFVFRNLPAATGAAARHPMADAFGEYVTVVWQDVTTQTVWQALRYAWDQTGPWKFSKRVSPTGSVADYPTAARNSAVAWQQYEADGTWEARADVGGVGYNLSQTPDTSSCWPHIDATLTTSAWGQPVVAALHGLWTEATRPDMVSEARLGTLEVYEGDSRAEEGLSHLVLCGLEDPSPHCRHRDGRGQRRGIPFDYGTDSLGYTLRCLDPRYSYRADLLFVGDRGSSSVVEVRSGAMLLGTVTFSDQRVETLSVDIPSDLMQGASELPLTVARVSGEYVVLALARLRAYEPLPGGGGGQIAASAPLKPERHLACGPNPSAGRIAVSYAIGQSPSIDLAVFDATGRRVTTLARGRCADGQQTVTWNGCDARGNRVADGIYFCRLSSGGATLSRKLVLRK